MGTDLTAPGILSPEDVDATTNTATINAAVAVQPQNQGGVIELPEGSWPIGGTIRIQNKIGVTLRGQGRHATTLKWVAPASDSSIIELRNCRACVIEEMAIQGPVDAHNNPNPASAPFAAIESRRFGYPSGGYEGANHVFRNLVINYSGTTKYGIVFSSSKDPACVPDPDNPDLCNADANNDFATISTVTVLRAEEACLALMATQSVGHMLVACNFGGAKYAVACGLSDPARMDVTPGGGFTWIGGGVSSSVCDFLINWIGGSGAVSITGVNSEDSPRFFESAANKELKNPISIRDCRISVRGLPAAHPEMVLHQAPGPLTFTGCTFNKGVVIPIVKLIIDQPTVHHVTGNLWAMGESDRADCIQKQVLPELKNPANPAGDYPGGQLVIEESNVFLNENEQLNSLGRVNQRRGIVTFTDQDPATKMVKFTSPEPNVARVNEVFLPINPSRYYVATSVEVDESNPPEDACRHATINSLEDYSFRIRIGKQPGPGKCVRVHWMIMR
jgi:hypothetical protein